MDFVLGRVGGYRMGADGGNWQKLSNCFMQDRSRINLSPEERIGITIWMDFNGQRSRLLLGAGTLCLPCPICNRMGSRQA